MDAFIGAFFEQAEKISSRLVRLESEVAMRRGRPFLPGNQSISEIAYLSEQLEGGISQIWPVAGLRVMAGYSYGDRARPNLDGPLHIGTHTLSLFAWCHNSQSLVFDIANLVRTHAYFGRKPGWTSQFACIEGGIPEGWVAQDWQGREGLFLGLDDLYDHLLLASPEGHISLDEMVRNDRMRGTVLLAPSVLWPHSLLVARQDEQIKMLYTMKSNFFPNAPFFAPVWAKVEEYLKEK